MPVLLGTVGIALDIADQFAVGLRGGVETKRDFNEFVLQVPVDGLGAADDLDSMVLFQEILGKDCCIGV